VIVKGTHIHCGKCGAHILTAAQDVHPYSGMESKHFTLPDGMPLAYQAEKICPVCGLSYNTIFTDTAKTD
jgi:hypothetical protein